MKKRAVVDWGSVVDSDLSSHLKAWSFFNCHHCPLVDIAVKIVT